MEIIRRRFDVVENGDNDWSAFPKAAWRYESQRFTLWADNLGLHHRGHSSLDYRLRESYILQEYVSGLLGDLKSSLDDREFTYIVH